MTGLEEGEDVMICPECDSEVAHKPGCGLGVVDMWQVLKAAGFDSLDLFAALRSGIEAGEIDAALVDGEIGTVVVFDRKDSVEEEKTA